MRFVTISEAERWLGRQRMSRLPKTSPDARFIIDDHNDKGTVACAALLKLCDRAEELLFLLGEHNLTSDQRKQQMEHLWRNQPTCRGLSFEPGVIASNCNLPFVEKLLATSIGPGSWWTLWIYISKVKTTVCIHESTVLDLWTRRRSEVQALARKLRSVKIPG